VYLNLGSWTSHRVPSHGDLEMLLFDSGSPDLKRYKLGGKEADCKEAPGLLYDYIPQDCHPALVEITSYLLGAFGSGQRLDYGTGHELSFAAFLCTLFLLRVLDPAQDAVAAVLVIFPKYKSS